MSRNWKKNDNNLRGHHSPCVHFECWNCTYKNYSYSWLLLHMWTAYGEGGLVRFITVFLSISVVFKRDADFWPVKIPSLPCLLRFIYNALYPCIPKSKWINLQGALQLLLFPNGQNCIETENPCWQLDMSVWIVVRFSMLQFGQLSKKTLRAEIVQLDSYCA